MERENGEEEDAVQHVVNCVPSALRLVTEGNRIVSSVTQFL